MTSLYKRIGYVTQNCLFINILLFSSFFFWHARAYTGHPNFLWKITFTLEYIFRTEKCDKLWKQ